MSLGGELIKVFGGPGSGVGSQIGAITRRAQLIDPAAAASLTVPGLNGNLDLNYLILVRVIKDANPDYIRIRMNLDVGLNYNWASYGFENAASGFAGQQGQSYIGLHNDDLATRLAANESFNAQLTLFAGSGLKRRLLGQSQLVKSSNAKIEGNTISAEWTNTTDNLTSITILTGAGVIGGVGSFIKIYAIP